VVIVRCEIKVIGVAPEEAEESEIVNLMDALKHSVAHAHAGRAGKRTRKCRRPA
jgi:non-homologous end joining protein Ku